MDEPVDAVEVDDIIRVLNQNSARAKLLVQHVVGALQPNKDACVHRCDRALDSAIMTQPEHQCPQLKAKLSAITARVMPT